MATASFYPVNSPISNFEATSSTDNTRERGHELRSAVRVSRGPPVSLFHIMWHDDIFYNYSVCDLRFKTSSSRNHWFLEEEVHFCTFKNRSFSRFWTNEWFLKTKNGLLPQEMSDFWRKKFWIANTLLSRKILFPLRVMSWWILRYTEWEHTLHCNWRMDTTTIWIDSHDTIDASF